MTTFQDPPPHSRRAARQSERGEGSAPTPVEAVPYAFDAAEPASAEQSAPEQAAASQTEQQAPPSSPPHTGRRVQQPAQSTAPDDNAPGFEPLTYSTQGRISPPASEQSQQQPLASAPAPGSVPGAGQPCYRVRDFSPEGGRRSAGSREPAPGSPLASAASFPAPPRPVELDYQTQGVPPSHAHSAASVPVEDTQNHTLSRRELRELRAAAEQQAPPLQMPPSHLPEPIDTLLNSGPIDIPTLAPPPGQSQALAEAMAEFDMLTRSRREAEARARDAQVASLATPIIPTQQQPVVQPSAPAASAPAPFASAPAPSAPLSSVPVASAPVPSAPVPSAPVASAPAPVVSSPVAPPEVFSAPEPSEPVSIQSVPVTITSVPVTSVPIDLMPVESVPVESAPVESVPQPSTPEAPMLVTPVFLEPEVPAQPTGAAEPTDAYPVSTGPTTQEIDAHGGRSPRASNHWRVQAAKEDDELPYENTLSRTVGSNTSAITTSALVLPSVPQPDSMLGSLTSTGEILVTGSINLPRSLGSTGAHPDRVDNSDYEEDPFDSQVAAPDSAPVRAIRAISSNTSTRGVIENKKPQGNRLLTVGIIVASALAVGLLGVLVVALATGKL
jgi:hypothetical protein